MSLLLHGNAVNCAVTNQDASGLTFGAQTQTRPPELAEDMAKLLPKGVDVYIVEEDLAQRGIRLDELIAGLKLVAQGQLAKLFVRFDQVWHRSSSVLATRRHHHNHERPRDRLPAQSLMAYYRRAPPIPFILTGCSRPESVL